MLGLVLFSVRTDGNLQLNFAIFRPWTENSEIPARVFCGLRNAESCQGVICGKSSAERSANYPLSLFRIPQPKNSAFSLIAKLPFARIAQHMCNRCIPASGIPWSLEKIKNEKWFIRYSSSMLDCTSNKTLKQEHTIQNYNTPVTHNIQ